MHVLRRVTVPATVAGRRLAVSCLRRDGDLPVVLVLPGLGMPATESLGVGPERVLPGRALVVPDVPGTGDSPGIDGMTVEDLAGLAEALVNHLAHGPAVVVGHSMGGLAGLLLCLGYPRLVAGFANVEGNLGPGDCFVSGRVVSEPFDHVVGTLARSRAPGTTRYASTLGRVRDLDTLRSLSRSLVAHCAGSPLLEWFTALTLPKIFVTGTSSHGIPYLADLERAGVPLVRLSRCGHFPMYSRPAAYWAAIEEFVEGLSRPARTAPR